MVEIYLTGKLNLMLLYFWIYIKMMFLITSSYGLNIFFFKLSTLFRFYLEDNRTSRAPSLTWLRGNTRTGNLTGSRFASPCDDGSSRREIELGAQQYPRKWTSERIKSPCWLSHGRRNFIMEPANSAAVARNSRPETQTRTGWRRSSASCVFRDSFKTSTYICEV